MRLVVALKLELFMDAPTQGDAAKHIQSLFVCPGIVDDHTFTSKIISLNIAPHTGKVPMDVQRMMVKRKQEIEAAKVKS